MCLRLRMLKFEAGFGSEPMNVAVATKWATCFRPFVVQPAMAILTVRHVTTYRYRRPVAFGEHRMMFRPRDSYDQRLIDSRLLITPEPVRVHWIHDPFGNCVALA